MPGAVYVSLNQPAEARRSGYLTYFGNVNEPLNFPNGLCRFDMPWLMFPGVYSKTLEQVAMGSQC